MKKVWIPALPARVVAKSDLVEYRALQLFLKSLFVFEVVAGLGVGGLAFYWLGFWRGCLLVAAGAAIRTAGWYHGVWFGENKLDDGYFAEEMNPGARFSESRRLKQ